MVLLFLASYYCVDLAHVFGPGPVFYLPMSQHHPLKMKAREHMQWLIEHQGLQLMHAVLSPSIDLSCAGLSTRLSTDFKSGKLWKYYLIALCVESRCASSLCGLWRQWRHILAAHEHPLFSYKDCYKMNAMSSLEPTEFVWLDAAASFQSQTAVRCPDQNSQWWHKIALSPDPKHHPFWCNQVIYPSVPIENS